MGTSSVCATIAGGAFFCFIRDQHQQQTKRLLLLKPTSSTPLATWTLQAHVNLRRFIPSSRWNNIGLHNHGDDYSDDPGQSFRFRGRRSFGASGRGGDATVSAEETSQCSKVTKASLATRSSNVVTSLISLLLLWMGNLWSESARPELERVITRSEPVRYWASITCVALCWLSVAFFLHLQVHKWEFTTMAMADGAFDPGGGFCHNTGLGCQISFIAI